MSTAADPSPNIEAHARGRASQLTSEPSSANASAMADQTVAAVRRFSRFYTRQLGVLDQGILHSSYTLAEVRVMYEIAHGEDVSAVDLTEQLRIDPGYLSRIIRKLERLKLIKRVRCTEDRRRSILALTAKGAVEFRRLDIQQDRDVGLLLRGLGPQRRRKLVAAMRLVEEDFGTNQEPAAPVRLRSAEPGDLGWIVHRFSRLFWEEYRYDQRFEALVAGIASDFLKRAGDERQHCWLAERDGEILGSVLLMEKSKTVAQLRLLYVEPPERRRGLAQRLVNEAIAFARAAGYRQLMLWTQSEEAEARRLYQRLGFRPGPKRAHRDFTERKLTAETWELEL